MPGPRESRKTSRADERLGATGAIPDRRWFTRSDNGEVVVRDAGGAVVWRGAVADTHALLVVDVGDARTALVVLDWSRLPPGVEEWHPFENLVRLDERGEVIWRAELPAGESRYTSVRLENGSVIGHGSRGDIVIDLSTGRAVENRQPK